MAWNADDWRLAREAFLSTRRAITAVHEAGNTLVRENPELVRRLTRAMGNRAPQLRTAADQVERWGATLPTTEPEARRAIMAAQRWKPLFVQLDSWIAEQARLGRSGLVLADHGALGPAGWTDARLAIQEVPWGQVATLMRVAQAAPRRPAAPLAPAPGRRRRRGVGRIGMLPLIVLGILLLTAKK